MTARYATAIGCLLLAMSSLVTSGCTLLASPFGALAVPVNFVRDQVAYNDNTDSFVLGWRNHVWSKKAWYQHEEMFCGHPYQKDLGKGFRSGYVAVANGGSGCPPLLPPREYWSWRYQSPEGQAKAAAWFEGYPLGAAAAEKDGIANWGFIQTSYTAGSKSPQAREYYKKYVENKQAAESAGEEVPAAPDNMDWLDPAPAIPSGTPSPAPANPTSEESLPSPGPRVVPPQPSESRAQPVPRQPLVHTAPSPTPIRSTLDRAVQPGPAPAPLPAPYVVVDSTPRGKLGGANPVYDAADLPPTPPAVLKGNAKPLPRETAPRGRVRGVTTRDDKTAMTEPTPAPQPGTMAASNGLSDSGPTANAPAGMSAVPSWWQPARQLALAYDANEADDQPPSPQPDPAPVPVSHNPFADRLAQRLEAITGANK